MNVKNLVRLANQDNRNLVVLVTQWMKNGINDPIAPARELISTWLKMFVYAGLSVFGIILFLCSLWLQQEEMPAITGIISAIFAAGGGGGLAWESTKLKHFHLAKKFCASVSLLEGVIGAPLESMEFISRFYDGRADADLEAYLYNQAQAVKGLQAIPWRTNEAAAAKTRFDKALSDVRSLLNVTKDYEFYFNSKR